MRVAQAAQQRLGQINRLGDRLVHLPISRDQGRAHRITPLLASENSGCIMTMPLLLLELAVIKPSQWSGFGGGFAAPEPRPPGRSGGAEGSFRPPRRDDYLSASPLEES